MATPRSLGRHATRTHQLMPSWVEPRRICRRPILTTTTTTTTTITTISSLLLLYVVVILVLVLLLLAPAGIRPLRVEPRQDMISLFVFYVVVLHLCMCLCMSCLFVLFVCMFRLFIARSLFLSLARMSPPQRPATRAWGRSSGR